MGSNKKLVIILVCEVAVIIILALSVIFVQSRQTEKTPPSRSEDNTLSIEEINTKLGLSSKSTISKFLSVATIEAGKNLMSSLENRIKYTEVVLEEEVPANDSDIFSVSKERFSQKYSEIFGENQGEMYSGNLCPEKPETYCWTYGGAVNNFEIIEKNDSENSINGTFEKYDSDDVLVENGSYEFIYEENKGQIVLKELVVH